MVAPFKELNGGNVELGWQTQIMRASCFVTDPARAW